MPASTSIACTREPVAPAIERAGLSIRSWRSVDASTSIQTQTLGDIISSDILLADVTTANPNVMYELGVRHAMNRGPTVLLGAGPGPSPFYVAFLQRIIYDPVSDLDEPDALRARITEAFAIRRAALGGQSAVRVLSRPARGAARRPSNLQPPAARLSRPRETDAEAHPRRWLGVGNRRDR